MMFHHHFDRVEMLMVAVTIFCLAYIIYAVWVLPNEEAEASCGDWPEDFPHENGNYMNRCVRCQQSFMGNKHRAICKRCDS